MRTGKKLPVIPNQNFVNRNRSSALGYVDQNSTFDENFRPVSTPTHRRKMPQIPTTRRSMSRQSSLNEDNYGGYRTPESSSHRGASLPPTPTKAPRMLSRVVNQSKPFNSLPPTPGRQLPKPNSNFRAKTRRNSLIKRTSSVEYTDGVDNYYDNYYNRSGAVSVGDTYNDYYNPAYQSIDNLPAQADETDVSALIKPSDNRTSVNVEYQQNTYNQHDNDLYYGIQDNVGNYQGQCYNDMAMEAPANKGMLVHAGNLDGDMEPHEDDYKVLYFNYTLANFASLGVK